MQEQARIDLGPTLPSLRSVRVVLRWLTPMDVPALFAIFGDPEVTRFSSRPPMRGLACAEAFLSDTDRHFAERSHFTWGVEVEEKLIGTCALLRLDADHRRAEVGYALAKAHWGKGYASELLPLLIQFAFDSIHLRKLSADVDPRNVASIRILERAGFKQEGYFRQHYFVNGEIQDAVIYGLLRSDSIWALPPQD